MMKLVHISWVQVGDEGMTLPYWLSNASALLCLLQKNLRSNGFLTANTQRSAGSAGLNGRVTHVSGLTFILSSGSFSSGGEYYFTK